MGCGFLYAIFRQRELKGRYVSHCKWMGCGFLHAIFRKQELKGRFVSQGK
jgi:hypothetical protein